MSAEERYHRIDFLLVVAKKNGWTVSTNDIFGKLLTVARKLYPQVTFETQQSYATSTFDKMKYEK